jgi:hypothetical protein
MIQNLTLCAYFCLVWDRLYLVTARQDLVAMHFYKSATTLDMQSCMSIFIATSSVLELVCNLDKDYGLHYMSTRFVITATLLSLASIARILKGPFAGYLDQTLGYKLFDAGVRFVRSCSVQKADYGERGATFADQLWKSERCFATPTDQLILHSV